MKNPIVLTLVLIAFVAPDDEWKPTTDKKVANQTHLDCLQETGATDDQVDKIYNLKNSDEKQVKAYIHCVAKKMGLFTDDKGYDVDRMIAQISVLFDDAEKARAGVVACISSNEENSTPAERAYSGHLCFLRSMVGLSWKGTKTNDEVLSE